MEYVSKIQVRTGVQVQKKGIVTMQVENENPNTINCKLCGITVTLPLGACQTHLYKINLLLVMGV